MQLPLSSVTPFHISTLSLQCSSLTSVTCTGFLPSTPLTSLPSEIISLSSTLNTSIFQPPRLNPIPNSQPHSALLYHPHPSNSPQMLQQMTTENSSHMVEVISSKLSTNRFFCFDQFCQMVHGGICVIIVLQKLVDKASRFLSFLLLGEFGP